MNIKDFVIGSSVELESLSQDEHKTQPPARYSETSLISALEKLNIGRPSTFASIVSVIQERGYAMKVKGRLVPTFKGFAVARILDDAFTEYVDYGYTGQMEDKLDEIGHGEVKREEFLKDFWRGGDGFENVIEEKKKNIDWDNIRELSTIDLGNGYSVNYSKNGVFLQDNNAPLNDKGFKPSVKLDDDTNIDDILDSETCAKLVESLKDKGLDRELGELTDGAYAGRTVWLKYGKFGPYLQAISSKKSEKPVNQSISEEDYDLAKIELKDVVDKFSEVKLPRNLSPNYFVGIGKRGAYIGYKKTAKSRKAQFKSLPEEYDPRTVSLEEVEKVWNE